MMANTTVWVQVDFPWLSDAQKKWILEQTKSVELSKQKQAQYDLYKQVLPVTVASKKQDDRLQTLKELNFASQSETDPTKKQAYDLTLKTADLANYLRQDWLTKWYNLSTVTDEQLVNKLIKTVPQWDVLFSDYINWKSDKLLKVAAGQTTATQAAVVDDTPTPVGQAIRNVVGWAYDAATGTARLAATLWAKGVWRLAKQLWADEEKTNALVQSYLDSNAELSAQWMGAETDSLAYNVTKWIGIVAQMAAPVGWLTSVGGKIAWIVPSVSKWITSIAGKIGWAVVSPVSNVASKVLWAWVKWAPRLGKAAGFITEKWLEWLWQTVVYKWISEQKLPTKWELAMWAALNVALPAAVEWLKSFKRYMSSIPLKQWAVATAPKVSQSTYDDLVEKANFKLKNPTAQTPLKTIQTDLDNLVDNKLQPQLDMWWQQLEKMRVWLTSNTAGLSKTALKSQYDDMLASANAQLVKSGKKYIIKWLWGKATTLTKWEKWTLMDLWSEISNIVGSKQPVSAWSIDSLIQRTNKNYWALQRVEWTASSALGKFKGALRTTLDDVVDKAFPAAKGRYSELAKIRDFIDENFGRETGTKGTALLRRIFGQWDDAAVAMFNSFDKIVKNSESTLDKAYLGKYIQELMDQTDDFTHYNIPRPSVWGLTKWAIDQLSRSLYTPTQMLQKLTKWYQKPAPTSLIGNITEWLKWKWGPIRAAIATELTPNQ